MQAAWSCPGAPHLPQIGVRNPQGVHDAMGSRLSPVATDRLGTPQGGLVGPLLQRPHDDRPYRLLRDTDGHATARLHAPPNGLHPLKLARHAPTAGLRLRGPAATHWRVGRGMDSTTMRARRGSHRSDV